MHRRAAQSARVEHVPFQEEHVGGQQGAVLVPHLVHVLVVCVRVSLLGRIPSKE